MAALRVLFDTNAYDAILSAGDEARIVALAEAGNISIMLTPVQEDEIRQIRDRTRQNALLALFRRLGGRPVDPASVIADDVTYLSRDEILTRVAEACCDRLVTNDRSLAAGCSKAISYAEFARQLTSGIQ